MIACRRDLYLTTHNTHNRQQPCPRWIRNHSFSRREAAAIRRRRGECDRPNAGIVPQNKPRLFQIPFHGSVVCKQPRLKINFSKLTPRRVGKTERHSAGWHPQSPHWPGIRLYSEYEPSTCVRLMCQLPIFCYQQSVSNSTF